jgi:hypothetical protein
LSTNAIFAKNCNQAATEIAFALKDGSGIGVRRIVERLQN